MARNVKKKKITLLEYPGIEPGPFGNCAFAIKYSYQRTCTPMAIAPLEDGFFGDYDVF